jgi:hypothetical protein
LNAKKFYGFSAFAHARRQFQMWDCVMRTKPLVVAFVAIGTLAALAFVIARANKTTLDGETVLDEATVYVTATGNHYHAEGCRTLSRSRETLALGEAVKNYAPCRLCHPTLPARVRI